VAKAGLITWRWRMAWRPSLPPELLDQSPLSTRRL